MGRGHGLPASRCAVAQPPAATVAMAGARALPQDVPISLAEIPVPRHGPATLCAVIARVPLRRRYPRPAARSRAPGGGLAGPSPASDRPPVPP